MKELDDLHVWWKCWYFTSGIIGWFGMDGCGYGYVQILMEPW